MSCFAQTSDGDFDISSGNLFVVSDSDECLAVKVTNRFKLFLGEWFMDTRIGVPYFQVVFVKNPDLQAIAQMLKRVCLQTPGVKDLLQIDMQFISSTRQLICAMKLQSRSGAIISGGPGEPFIVEFDAKGEA